MRVESGDSWFLLYGSLGDNSYLTAFPVCIFLYSIHITIGRMTIKNIIIFKLTILNIRITVTF